MVSVFGNVWNWIQNIRHVWNKFRNLWEKQTQLESPKASIKGFNALLGFKGFKGPVKPCPEARIQGLKGFKGFKGPD